MSVFCNKCGYVGEDARHPGCDYLAAEWEPLSSTMLRSISDEALTAELRRRGYEVRDQHE